MSRASTLERMSALLNDQASRNSVLSLAQALFTLLAYFLVMRQVVVIIGLEALGLWSLTVSLVAFVRMLDMGGAQVLARLVATKTGHPVQQTQFIDSLALAGLLGFILLAALAYLGLKPFLLSSVDPALHSEAEWLLLGLVVTLPLNFVSQVHLGAIDGIGRADIRASIAITAIVLYSVTALLLIGSVGIIALVIAQFLQHGFSMLAARVTLRRKIDILSLFPWRLNSDKVVEAVSFGARLQIAVMPMALFDPLCRILIGRSVGLELLAIYELAAKFAASARTIAQAFTSPYLPEFARLLAKSESKAQKLFGANQPRLTAGAMALTSLQILSLPLVSYVLLGQIDAVFVLVSTALSLGWGVTCIGLLAQLYARAAGRLRYSIFGQWTLLALGAALVPLLGLLDNDLWMLIAPSFAIALGHLIAFGGEVHSLNLNPLGQERVFLIAGSLFALITSSIVAVTISAMV